MTVRAAILLALIATAARALPPPTPCPGCWVPAPFTSWQIQFTGTLDQSLNATLYEVDLFDTPPETVTALHAAGHRVICYLDAGTWEPFRPDASSYPDSVKGNPVADSATSAGSTTGSRPTPRRTLTDAPDSGRPKEFN